MKLKKLKTMEQLLQFLDGTQSVIFKIDTHKAERYQWLQHELVRFDYLTQSRINKGIISHYLIKVSRYSRAQLNRLIKQYRETGYIRNHHVVSKGFKTKYSSADIRLIAMRIFIHADHLITQTSITQLLEGLTPCIN